MASSQDTEITLGTGKMLALFFGLVVLCAIFFSMGFSLGKSTAKPVMADATPATSASNGPRPTAIKPATATANDAAFFKPATQKGSDAVPAPQSADANAASTPPASDSTPPDPMVPPPTSGYFVQVAAVTKQEDAQALVEALKSKQYPAFVAATSGADKLFHVQVGPYADVKDAEGMRAKLVSDGYNPILKK